MEPKEILTKRKIEALAAKYEITDPILRNLFIQNNSSEVKVFISHSSSNQEFIRKLLIFLEYSKGGTRGYVDWTDSLMPTETNAETAVLLKDRIETARKVIYVVTYESLKSVWCSWEIGYADKAIGVDAIAILAIKPNNGKWKNNEYLQQYPWIGYDVKRDLFLVHLLNGETETLYEWLSR